MLNKELSEIYIEEMNNKVSFTATLQMDMILIQNCSKNERKDSSACLDEGKTKGPICMSLASVMINLWSSNHLRDL